MLWIREASDAIHQSQDMSVMVFLFHSVKYCDLIYSVK